MNMPAITLAHGSVLVVIGIASYTGTGMQSVTALIPAFFGLAFVACGAIAKAKEGARKHAMHAAAFFALLGIMGGTPFKSFTTGEWGVAPAIRLLFALLCLAYLGICIKSFIDARRARNASAE